MKKSTKKKILYLVFILIMAVSGVFLYLESTKQEEEPEIYSQPFLSEIDVKEEDLVTEHVEKDVIKMSPDVDLAAERKKYNNPYIVGRVEIPNLFNVLIVQSDDNDFYLKHDIKRNYDIRGTEFLDYRVNYKANQLNIYGHNTRDPKIKVPFHKLENFLDKKFAEENKYIIYQHDGGKDVYKIVAMKQVYNDKKHDSPEHMRVNLKGEAFVNHIKTMITGNGVEFSRDVPFDENSKVIVLQTCSHDWSDGDAVYTIVGIKIDY